MNQIFNIKRFWLLLKTEIQSSYRTYIGVLSGTVVGIAFLTYMMNVGNQSLVFHTAAIYGMLFALFLIAPFLFFRNVYHRRKGVAYAMLPASQFEKILSAILQVVVVFPAAVMIVVQLCLLFINTFVADVTSWNLNQFLGFYWDTIAAQSIFFLGVFWFKYRKVAKTFLCIAIAIAAFTVISMSLFKLGFLEPLSTFQFRIDEVTLNTIIYIIFPLVPWVISFLKLQRTQI